MLTDNLHRTLELIAARYDSDQIVIVADGVLSECFVKNGGFGLGEDVPMLTLTGCCGLLGSIETIKSIQTVQLIWNFLFDHSITRRGLMVCLGGGVVTDLGGFAAATYKRGMDYINIPTTLLAMVDASVGGKTGFNYRNIKNSIGVFHSPIETIIFPPFLDTLPPHELLSGYAEMLKTALLDESGRLWRKLMACDLNAFSCKENCSVLIADTLEIKQRIVETDPYEAGVRKALNFGHTFGHALEEINMSATKPMLHGYAVLYGMIAELYLSVTLCGCSREPLHQLSQLMLHYYGRPQCKCFEREQLLQFMQQDKKNDHSGEINCTLLTAIGKPIVNQIIPIDKIEEAWNYLFSL